MVPVKEPVVMPVATTKVRSTLKLPVAPANRPVPPSDDRGFRWKGRQAPTTSRTGEVRSQGVSIGSRELARPDSDTDRLVYEMRDLHREETQVRRVACALDEHGRDRRGKRRHGDRPLQPASERHLLTSGRRAKNG